MNINPKEIVRFELIGLMARVVDSKNKSIIGIEGKVVDETKNMLMIEQGNGVKRIIKDQVIVEFKFYNKKVRVDGQLLVGRPEDRIKKVRRLI